MMTTEAMAVFTHQPTQEVNNFEERKSNSLVKDHSKDDGDI
jgi:hypothetical protein